MQKEIYFERAIFLSWYCSKGDCAFCFMSTQKEKIKNPKLARRTKESVLAEVLLCKLFNWKIEFLSGGYESYEFNELTGLIRDIVNVYGKKVWLNVGVLTENELNRLSPYLEGVSGAVECITPGLRDRICPSKPLKDIEQMFSLCDKLNLKKSMTLILGIGETITDFKYLKEFVEKHSIDQITFYRLKPQKNTVFEKEIPITKEYYSEWITLTRKEFPYLKIIAGSWVTHLDEISLLLMAGADGITKFPSIKQFNSKHAQKIESEVKKAGMAFKSNLTRKMTIDIDAQVNALDFDKKLKVKISEKLREYLSDMN
jgi:biotin synthase-like enzyme